MKKSYLFVVALLMSALLFTTSCKKEEEAKYGQILFWTNFNNGSDIAVYVGDEHGTITHFTATAPVCGSAGSYTTGLMPYGKYTYSASSTGWTWKGSVNLNTTCEKFELTK